MLGPGQRLVLFGLFCLVAIASAVLEAYMVVSLIANPVDFPSKALAASLSTGVLGGVGVLFVRLVDKTFVRTSITPLATLADLAAERNRIR